MPEDRPRAPGHPGRDAAVQQGRGGERARVPCGPGRRRPGTAGAVPGGIEAETRQILENVGALLHAVGLTTATWSRPPSTSRDFGDFAAMNAFFPDLFPTDPPTRATVGVTALAADYRVEIEVIATR